MKVEIVRKKAQLGQLLQMEDEILAQRQLLKKQMQGKSVKPTTFNPFEGKGAQSKSIAYTNY